MEEYHNRSKISGDIYRFLYFNNQSTRQEIAQALNISLPTTTRNLNILQDAGFIENAGENESSGGRKPAVYQCVPNSRYSVGIDITQNHLSIVLVDLALNIIDSRRIRIIFHEDHEYFSVLEKELASIIARNISNHSLLLGVGISLPVLLGDDHKTVSYASVISLSHNIYNIFSQYIHEPFLFFNDSNSAGLAESWRGNYTESVVYLSLCGSVGGAYMHNRGSEFGHMTIVPHGKRCYCGKYGCLDAYCASHVLTDFTGGNLKEFFDILDSGTNPGFENVFEEYTDYLAVAVNNLRMCYDCDIILGGNVGAYMTSHIEDFRQKAILLNPFENDGSYIKVCHYRTEAAAVGAAIYYIDQFVKNFPG